jgi:hypothetical protein
MPPTDPPELPRLPKLPPVRESAEHVLPPPADEQPAAESAAVEPPRDDPEGATTDAASRSEARRRAPRERSREEPTPVGGRRGARGSRTEDGRRYSTAGHGLVVALLALVFGALLLAPGMHKAAFNGQPGTKRDVSLALTGGAAHVSHALLLDRPRGLVQDAMGRGDADRINVAIVVPPATVIPKPGTRPTKKPTKKPALAKPPGKVAFTPKKKLRLWIAGDSLVITPGYSIVRAAGGSPVIQSVGGVEGHVATGLTRPDVFNWFQQISAQVKALKPHVVVLNFGANDDHNYMTGLPEGTSIGSFASPTWNAEYRRRVGAVMDTVNRAGGVVVWIGLPVTRSETQTQEFDRINALVLKEAKARPGKAIFIDTYTMFAGDTGGFVEYMENAKGDSVKVRAGDGVHFDVAGGDLIAREVLKQLNKQFDLTSWRNKKA